MRNQVSKVITEDTINFASTLEMALALFNRPLALFQMAPVSLETASYFEVDLWVLHLHHRGYVHLFEQSFV